MQHAENRNSGAEAEAEAAEGVVMDLGVFVTVPGGHFEGLEAVVGDEHAEAVDDGDAEADASDPDEEGAVESGEVVEPLAGALSEGGAEPPLAWSGFESPKEEGL